MSGLGIFPENISSPGKGLSLTLQNHMPKIWVNRFQNTDSDPDIMHVIGHHEKSREIISVNPFQSDDPTSATRITRKAIGSLCWGSVPLMLLTSATRITRKALAVCAGAASH